MAAQAIATREPETKPVLAAILEAASNPAVDPEKLRALLDLQDRVLRREQEIAFAENMCSAQSEMIPIVRDAQNDHTRSRYARLETIDSRIRPVYTRHGFSLSFNTGAPGRDGAVRMVCDVRHVAGHTKTYELEGDLDTAGAKGTSNKTSIQGLGSAVSYLRRYLTCMIFNLVLTNEDNDGNAAALEVARTKIAEMRRGPQPVVEIAQQLPESHDEDREPAEHDAPTELEQELHDSIVMVERMKAGRSQRGPGRYALLQTFASLKARYKAIGFERTYYAILSRYGVHHSSEFPADEEGISNARCAYKEMSLDLANREVRAQQEVR